MLGNSFCSRLTATSVLAAKATPFASGRTMQHGLFADSSTAPIRPTKCGSRTGSDPGPSEKSSSCNKGKRLSTVWWMPSSKGSFVGPVDTPDKKVYLQLIQCLRGRVNPRVLQNP